MQFEVKRPARSISSVGLLQVVALLTFTASLLALSASSFWLLELFSHFKLPYMLASIVCFVAFALLRHHLSALLMFMILMINIVSISPVFFSAAQAHTPGNGNIKIFLSNVYSQNKQYQLLLDEIHSADPDIIVLQELTPEWQQQIKPLLDDYPYHELIAQSGHFGIGLLSRLPVRQMQRIELGVTPVIQATVDLSGSQFNLLATHLMPPQSFELKAMRDRQLDAIGDYVNHQHLPLIVAGDLNMTPWSADYQQFVTATQLTNVRQGKGILPTWPARLSMIGLPLDHVLHSSQWHVEEVYTADYIGSDHLPIVAQLSL